MGDWKTIITIGREYGAGGRTVAKLLSDRLGIPHYDKEIITLAAEKSGLPEQTIRGPEQGSGKTLLSWFLPRGPMSAYDQAILAQANIIRKLAEEGPCIIVGRGADYILRDREDVLNVFLYADQADKLAYAMGGIVVAGPRVVVIIAFLHIILAGGFILHTDLKYCISVICRKFDLILWRIQIIFT